MNLIEKLIALLPILAGMNLGKDADMVFKLIALAEAEIARRMSATEQTRDEILADARATFTEAIKGADDLLKLGHENE